MTDCNHLNSEIEPGRFACRSCGEITQASMSLDEAGVYVAEVGWRFAHTMKWMPHWYTRRADRMDLEADFVRFVELILAVGEQRPWPRNSANPRYNHHYLDLDDWTYWSMEEPIEENPLVNRKRGEHRMNPIEDA